MIATLPTSYYDSLSGLSHFYVSAVCAGVRRSATTLVYQIAQEAFPEGGVIKTHSYLDVPPEVPIVITVRDFRDCVVSWWRMVARDDARRNAEEVATKAMPCGSYRLAALRSWVQPTPTFTLEDAVRFAGVIKQDVYAMQQYIARKSPTVLRYEDFVENLELLQAPLGGAWQRPLPLVAITNYTLKSNWGLRRFTDRPVPGWNAETASGPIEEGHCNEGTTGRWRDFCTAEVADELTRLLTPELTAFGYIHAPESHSANLDGPVVVSDNPA